MNLIRELLHYLNLENEVEDFEKIQQSIEKDLIFKGTNLWILIFAIIIASVGLNMNSTAVIIGAMLISPLMGPINGIGYSLATYNFTLFKTSIKNYGFAVIAGLAASTGYFALSPVSTAHSELLARTSPTIYDVLIAMFGGLAGMVAISSRQKGNVIPGVAIATALMPPLCTAGYGLATAQLQFFFGAFYLFTINTVFIALAAVLISQVLKFPITTLVDEGRKKHVNRWISFVIAITIIPSIYFGYMLVQREQFTENVARFTRNVSVFEGSYLLRSESNPSTREIRMVYGGSTLTKTHKERLTEVAKDFNLEKASLVISQGFSLDASERTELDQLKMEINRLGIELENSQKQKDSLIKQPETGEALLKELNALNPDILSCSFSGTIRYSIDGKPDTGIRQVILSTRRGTLKTGEKDRINAWLQQRLGTEKIRVFYEEIP